jgi:hypothetical protein
MTGRWLMLGLAVVLVPTAAAGQEALTRSPHGTLPAGLGCTSCHTVDGWQPVLQGFDHDTSTAFVLTGRHQDVACTMCHLQARFDEPKAGLTECGVCHLDIHRGALSPNCVECHGTDSFYGVDGIGVHQQTTFPLTGAHLQVTCAACHPGDERGAFVTRDIACASCHQQAYETAEPVNHVAAGFPLECDACHTTVAWQHAVRFDHVTVSNGFPLEGRHAEIRCASCHDPATMQPIFPTRNPNDCYACHQDDYAREHGSAFPTTCVGCHTVWGWEGAEFDHAIVAPQFPLEGPHADVACDGCHRTDDWSLINQPTGTDDCYACHAADYQREHGGSGFPTNCLACHQPGSWDNASFAQHDAAAFPIYSGRHRGTWQTCDVCHTVAGDYKAFSCLQCHEHSQARMDAAHGGRPGYVYDSRACYSCHPSGRGD